jgi:hypothetical protein
LTVTEIGTVSSMSGGDVSEDASEQHA